MKFSNLKMAVILSEIINWSNLFICQHFKISISMWWLYRSVILTKEVGKEVIL